MRTRVKMFTDTGDPVASRYAEALFEGAKAEGVIDQALDELARIGALLVEVPDLAQLMNNPDVEPDDKVRVLDRAFAGSWSSLVRSFMQMAVSMGRAGSLPAIASAFQAMVDAARGRLRVVVRSARPLPEPVLERLRSHLARAEHREIHLEADVAPELLGGVQLVLGHRVIDASVRRRVSDLREQLQSVRVH